LQLRRRGADEQRARAGRHAVGVFDINERPGACKRRALRSFLICVHRDTPGYSPGQRGDLKGGRLRARVEHQVQRIAPTVVNQTGQLSCVRIAPIWQSLRGIEPVPPLKEVLIVSKQICFSSPQTET